MALSNTHDLGTGVSYLADNHLIAELIDSEADISVPYADSKGIATIGIGVNITIPANMALVLDQLGVLSTYIDNINAGRAAENPPKDPLTTAEVNAIYINIVNDFESAINSYTISGNGDAGTSDSEQQLKAALDVKLQYYLGDVTASFELSEEQSKEKKPGQRGINFVMNKVCV